MKTALNPYEKSIRPMIKTNAFREVPFENAPPGIYLAPLFDGQRCLSKKFIINYTNEIININFIGFLFDYFRL